MRAATNKNYGPPDVLRVTEQDRPTIKANQVLVEVEAAAVTQGDRRLRAADFPGLSAVFGRLLIGVFGPRQRVGGSAFAGRVVAVGAKVTRFSVGDDVYGSVMHGAYAEYLAVDEDAPMARMPSNVNYEQAAALPYGGVTALVFLRDIAKVQHGERVLIVGASGGVGRSAVQIAAHLGAEVTGVCSRGQDEVRALGAKAVIDYRKEDFARRGERWDVILDTTEGNHFRAFRAALTRTGRYLSLYVTVRVLVEMMWTALRSGPRALVGVAMGDGQVLDDLRNIVEQGALSEPIAERHSLEHIVAAHRALEPRPPLGSVIVEVGDAAATPRHADTSPKTRHGDRDNGAAVVMA